MNPSDSEEDAQETKSRAQDDDTTSEQDVNSDKDDDESIQQARDLFKHLIILIESARTMYYCKESESSVKAVMKQLDEVCQLATSNPDLATHESLRMWPIMWSDYTRYVDDVLRELRSLQRNSTRLQDNIKYQNIRLNDAAVGRTMIIFDDEDVSLAPEEKRLN